MGLLAGSTVMLLTVIWGTCVLVGKCDIEDSVAKDGRDTKGLSLTGTMSSFLKVSVMQHCFLVEKYLNEQIRSCRIWS